MEPGFYRGDILFLDQPTKPLEVGDIVVFNTGRDIPIVHRLIKIHERRGNATDVDMLTKVCPVAGCFVSPCAPSAEDSMSSSNRAG